MKICIIPDPDNYGQDQIATIAKLYRELSRFNIDFVDATRQADVLLVHHKQLQSDHANRCIVVERADSSVNIVTSLAQKKICFRHV